VEPDEPNHAKARARAHARSGAVRARPSPTDTTLQRSRGACVLRRPGAALPQDTHVNYIFGAAERDGPPGPAPLNTPKVRKSCSSRPVGLQLPFGSEQDVPAPSPGGPRVSGSAAAPAVALPSPDGRSPLRGGFVVPFKTDATAHFPQRAEQLPSAPPAPPSAQTPIVLSHVAKMSLPELREALRARGLSPAGGLTALQERLTAALKGLPADTPEFVPQDSGIDWPSADEVDAGSRPTQARRSIRISATAGTGGGHSSLGYTLGAGGA
jgi:hypothetical protein